jgi:predicted O-methyltransferase YrrM
MWWRRLLCRKLQERFNSGMEEFDEVLAGKVDRYIESLFVRPDPVLEHNLTNSAAAGLPAIQVSPNQGRLIYLLAKMIRPQRILEIGTLGAYSTTWLARALQPGGKLITLEAIPRHVKTARENLAHAGLSQTVEVVANDAQASLRAMIASGEKPFDVIFIDADKTSYPAYLALVLSLSKSGTLILADNVIRNGRVMASQPEDDNARGAGQFNADLASNPRLESIILPIFREKFDGMAIALVR